MARPLKARLLLAFLLGAVSVAAYAPVGFFPLAWLAAGGLFWLLLASESGRAAAATGFAFGLGAFLAGVSWVFVSLHDFGGLPAPLAALATLLFCAVLALFPALLGALFGRWKSGRLAADVFAFSSLWALSEWLRGWVLTGFPWLALGYSQSPPSPLAGFAPLVGVFGVSFLCALTGACLAAWLGRYLGVLPCDARTGRRRIACSALPLLAAALLLAAGDLLREQRWTQPVGAPVRVALLQGNVAQELKWRPERFVDSMLTYYELARAHPAQLTILPETALPAFFDQLPAEYLADLTELARARGGDLLLGSVVGDRRRYTNAVVSLGASPRQTYSKQHLVPFGEFIPPGFSWFLALMQIPMSEFSRGGADQAPLAVAGQKVAMNICYEDVFGEEIIAALPQATILANVSNTAWFGRSLAQPQHLQIAQMRALESGRPMLRATNTGMTAVVAPDGRIEDALAPFVRAALVADVQGYTGLTPYARFGNTGVLLLAVLGLLPALLARRAAAGGKSR